MNYAYIRFSSAGQKESAQTQRWGILNFLDERKIHVDEWVVECVSGTKSSSDRLLGDLLLKLKKGDLLVIAEISRLGRALVDILETMRTLVDRGVRLYSAKERMEFGADIQSKVLSVVLGLVSELERTLLSARTKEALARLLAEGKILGRPRGSKSASKLDSKEDTIRELLAKGVSKASIAKILGVCDGTVTAFCITRGIQAPKKQKPVLTP